jgi:hypothetical protein
MYSRGTLRVLVQQQLLGLLEPPRQCRVIAFPDATITTATATGGGFGRRIAKMQTLRSQLLLQVLGPLPGMLSLWVG